MKKEIQQEARPKKSRFKLWLIVVLVLSASIVALFYGYRQQQLTAPQRLFSLGVKQESLGNIEAAEKSYRDIYQHYPHAPEAAEALLRSGKIWQYNHRDGQRALLSYLQLEYDYPDSPLVLPAREEAAAIVKYTLKDDSRAIEFYQRLLDLNTGQLDQYYYEIADCYFRLKNYPQARIELEILLEKFPDTPLAPEVLYRKGGMLLLEGRITAAQQDWQSLIDQYPDSSYRLQARFNLAKLLEEQGKLEEALLSYRQIEGFSDSQLLQKKIDHLEQRIAEKTGAQ